MEALPEMGAAWTGEQSLGDSFILRRQNQYVDQVPRLRNMHWGPHQDLYSCVIGKAVVHESCVVQCIT